MFRAERRKKRKGGVLYTATGLGLLYEAVPRLPRQAGVWPETFVLAWCGFAMLVVAANLWYVLGADKERAVSRDKSFAPLEVGMGEEAAVISGAGPHPRRQSG